MIIKDSIPSDAPLIAESIVQAIGEGHCREMTHDRCELSELQALFEELAGRDDTQYSYLNSLTARTDDGEFVGACVVYDGAKLAELRRPFLERAEVLFGLDVENVADETDPSEFYLDTLAVRKQYRGRGIGEALIRAAAAKAHAADKPLGLLVAKDNPKAQSLYKKVGFKDVGDREFMGIMMHHYQL